MMDRMWILGMSVMLSTPPLDIISQGVAVVYGNHGSYNGYREFVRDEIADFFMKGLLDCANLLCCFRLDKFVTVSFGFHPS